MTEHRIMVEPKTLRRIIGMAPARIAEFVGIPPGAVIVRTITQQEIDAVLDGRVAGKVELVAYEDGGY